VTEPDGIENVTFLKKTGYFNFISSFFVNVLWVAFTIPWGSLPLVKYPVEIMVVPFEVIEE
jgi:hypothetical protein